MAIYNLATKWEDGPMTENPKSTDKVPDDIPDAAKLIEELRATGDRTNRSIIIERYPVLETLAPVPVLADWLGMRIASIYAARGRKRSDGSKVWPDEDAVVFGLKMWKFSTIALHRAEAPGRGWNLRGEIQEGSK